MFLLAQTGPYDDYSIECVEDPEIRCECLGKTTKLNFYNLNGEIPDTFSLKITIVSNLPPKPENELVLVGLESEFFNWDEAQINGNSNSSIIQLDFPNNSGVNQDTFLIKFEEPYCDLMVTTGIPAYSPICDIFQESVSLELSNYQCSDGLITYGLNVVNSATDISINTEYILENVDITLIQASGNSFNTTVIGSGSFLMNECLVKDDSQIDIEFCTEVIYKGTKLECCNHQTITLSTC